MQTEEEIAAIRAEVAALKSTALTREQHAAVDRLVDHTEHLVHLVEVDKFRKTFWATVRSWSVAGSAALAAIWVVKDGLSRVLRALLEP